MSYTHGVINLSILLNILGYLSKVREWTQSSATSDVLASKAAVSPLSTDAFVILDTTVGIDFYDAISSVQPVNRSAETHCAI